MTHDYLKGFVRIGIFIGGGGLVLLLLEPRASAEWTVSLCSALMGLALIVGAIVLSRILK